MNTKFLISVFILVVCTRAVQSTNRKTQKKFIYSIKSVVGRICSDITTVKEKITDLEMENHELQEKVRELDDLQIKVSDLEIENNELKMKVSDLEQTVNQTDPVVAFSAYVDENTEPSGSENAYVFDKVLTNEGQAYDESTGVFTCPFSGIYVFTVVASARHDNQSHVTLKVNTNDILDTIAEGNDIKQDDQGANTAVVQCNKGDKVWITGTGFLHGDSVGQSNARTSSFSGFLLHPTTV